MAFTRVCDDNLQIWILIQDLLDTAVVTPFLPVE